MPATDTHLDSLSPKYNAIHRALLAGLIGNVGFRSEPHEYTGPRNMRFNLWPGSSLFKKEPHWVMAAELVQTTRLYARTLARVSPHWIERAADHLVKREYTNHRWRRDLAQVVADERVTLYAMLLFGKRMVNYGPVDPAFAREMFITHALVDGDYEIKAPFFVHNRRLMEEVQHLEVKSRQRDVLVEPQVRFAFYDARIPPHVNSGELFEQWRRSAERKHPRLLFMTRRDLMKHAAEDVTLRQFPDSMVIAGQPLNLDYHLEPGHIADGVTTTIPLAILNQIPAEPFEWLVPGLLREKVIELIRSLPKSLRTSFVPTPDHADVALGALGGDDSPAERSDSLLDALARQLGRMSGLSISPADFDLSGLPPHLFMNFRVLDEQGKQLTMGRDLAKIRRNLGVAARITFANLPHNEYNREPITTWDFGDLPERIPVSRHGITFYGYPALVDTGEAVALRLFDSPEAARTAMPGGVKRLLMSQLRKELRELAHSLPGLAQMALHYAPLGNSQELRIDMVEAIANRAFLPGAADLRKQEHFRQRAESAWRDLQTTGDAICDLAGRILASYHALSLQLESPAPAMLHPAIIEMRHHLAHLVYKGFLRATPYEWLMHLPRYLEGIRIRYHRLVNAGLARDREAAGQIAPLWDQYRHRLTRHQQEGIHDAELGLYRWMLEELRISLFAQELKTSMPISAKRLQAQWAKTKP